MQHFGVRLVFLFIFFASLHGCAVTKTSQVKSLPIPNYPEEQRARQEAPAERIESHDFSATKDDGVVGRLAVMRLEKGDSLPDIARHFGLGINQISAANPGIDVWVPEAGGRLLLPLSFILPDAPRNGIVINLAALRIFHFKGDRQSPTVSTYPIGIGTAERPSPTGQMVIERKMVRPTWHVPASIAEDHRKKGDPLPTKVLPGPLNPLGEYALYLSKPSYLIHGTNKPASIGLRATNGCIRLYPEDIKRLYEATPVKAPVLIVNQPYLMGQRNGVIYLEVHAPLEDLDSDELDELYAKLRNLEKNSARRLDWGKVKTALAEARGIPVPLFASSQGNVAEAAEIIEVRRPDKFYGKPEVPELKLEAWSVLAADLRDETDAARIAAIINHQGPQIPARVVSKSDGYRVIAGPFNDAKEAKNAAKRLRIDLEIEGQLIEPVRKKR